MLGEKESSCDDRLNYFFLNLIGQVVTVYCVDGSVLEGLFIAVDDDRRTVLLSKSRNCTSLIHTSDDSANVRERLKVQIDDVVMMDATQVTFRVAFPSRGVAEPLRGNAGVKTQRWADFNEEDGEDLESGNTTKGWDQFKENEKRFGVKSSYKEELYTTRLDHQEFSKEQHAQAERLAREIERSGTSGIHHRVERGEDVDVDEGQMYSDVHREASSLPKTSPPPSNAKPLKSGGGTAYVPPGRRANEASPPPVSVGDATADERAMHMATTQPAVRQPVEPSPIPVGAASGHHAIAAAPPPQESHKKVPSLNASAAEWKPGGGYSSAPSSPAGPPAEDPPRVIRNLLEEMARALEKCRDQKSCSPDWPGDDLYYDEENDPNGARYAPNANYAQYNAPHQGYPQPAPGPAHPVQHHPAQYGGPQGSYGHGAMPNYPPQASQHPAAHHAGYGHHPQVAPHGHMAGPGPAPTHVQHPSHMGGPPMSMHGGPPPRNEMMRGPTHMDPMGGPPNAGYAPGRGGMPGGPGPGPSHGMAGRGGSKANPQQPIPAGVGLGGPGGPGLGGAPPMSIDAPPTASSQRTPTSMPGRGRGVATGMVGRGGGASPVDEGARGPPGAMPLDNKAKRKP